MVRNILVPIDCGDASPNALRFADAWAAEQGFCLHVLTVSPPTDYPFETYFGYPGPEDEPEFAHLQDYAQPLKHKVPWTLHQLRGCVYRQILQAAEEIPADLVVMTTLLRQPIMISIL